MSVDIIPPVLSMQLGATRVAQAHQEVARGIAALRASIVSDTEFSARDRSRCDNDTRRILSALEQLEQALDAAAMTQPLFADSQPRSAHG
ncbi:hypothetical protein D9V41_14110 [Aeromicrobium phragmitis]|uniref:Uncharacterized protein n=1 Tax=Aeromicrobium phragmitis TaxID=2478914 RepID=A0A3L8PK25_9ACTN|nr:hypothetical protein [Aeromicrobium phragmitis]RLV54948.1 hypothetical protein D9V41_14110 [Aeromicrobium phragmitis]